MTYSPAAQEKYDRENTIRISLKLNRKTDSDILDCIEALEKTGLSKQQAVKCLIRQTKKDA